MFLLIDWGNSFLKFISVAELSLSAIQQAEIKQTHNLDQLKQALEKNYQKILVSSVRQDSDNLALKKLLQQYSRNLFWASTANQACGVSCAYPQPQQLGIDRWLAVLAADQISNNVAIISVGSAITFDIVKHHHHLGGQIVPGVKLLLASLMQTGQVKADTQFEHDKTFALGRTTTACVHQGAETLIASYLKELILRAKEEFEIDLILFCGGGGEHWSQHFSADGELINYHPRLVFQGLVRLHLG